MRYVFLFMVLITNLQASFEMKEPEGFHWYKDSKKRRELPSRPKLSNLHEFSHKHVTHSQEVKRFQEEMEEVKSKAILDPTFENVSAYKRFQEKAIDQSTDFSKMWVYVNQVEGGQREEDNADNQFRKLYQQEQDKLLDQKIKQTAQKQGLFFFFKKDCPYCHQFAPIIKKFADRYGFEVKAISKDGGRLPEFPQSSVDNGIGNVLNPEGVYPALFLANPQTNDVMPIAWGLVSEEQLRTNVKITYEAIERAGK